MSENAVRLNKFKNKGKDANVSNYYYATMSKNSHMVC